MSPLPSSIARLAQAVGVTRVARVTGLDRAGIEVAAAVRPAGHVLQVTQGKGATWAQAVASALGEAAELAAAEAGAPVHAGWAQDVDGVWGATVEARELGGRGRRLIRADAVYCPPAGGRWPGPVASRWTSNGLGAHRVRARAVEHALLEVVERDALARVAPHGWTPALARARLLGPPLPWVEALEARGFRAFVFDFSPPGARLPTCAALLFDEEDGVVPVTAGYACRRTPEAAATAAVLEAAQSRLTEIHGARDDVVLGQRRAGLELRATLDAARPRRGLGDLPAAPRGALAECVVAPAWVVTLTRRPLHVVKVMVDGALTSDLL